MIKLKCQKCGEIWYTANTRPNQECSECGGDLTSEDLITEKDIKIKGSSIIYKNEENKVLHLV